MEEDKSLKGLGLFSLELLHLISIGKKETLKEVEKHFEDSNIIEYIYNKYKDNFTIDFDNRNYNNKVLNNYFYDYSSYILGNEDRKYGIVNEDDGLLLIVALVLDTFERYSPNMKIE